MCGRCDELQRQDENDARFICELEKRSMSTWSDEELARYSELTGQANGDIPCGCGDQNCIEDMGL